jgi:hypothetical protein
MLLKLIIFAIVAALIYRFVGGKLPFIDRSSSKEEHDFGKIETTSACANCGIYMTEEDAIIYQRKAYCSNTCLEEAKAKR